MSSPESRNEPTTAVFIVHGHDRVAREEVARFVDRVGLEPIILEEQADAGQTIIEKFEREAARAGAAIVLLTPDDVGGPKAAADQEQKLNPRARQNVVLELGYFAGALGRGRVCGLLRGDLEIPSDYVGVLYTRLDEHGGWKLKLAQNLKKAGLPVDTSKLI